MSSEDYRKVFPLESFALEYFPRTTHNLAWSPDAELAIACDDCVYIFLPVFSAHPHVRAAKARYSHQFNDAALQFPVAPIKPTNINRHLFDNVNQEFPMFEFYAGGGSGPVTSQGSSINHAVAIEWSPNGLGRMNRSVLAVLTGAGILTINCEGGPNQLAGLKVAGRSARNLQPWMAAWCVGGGFLIPAAAGQDTPPSPEYITSFSWARDTDAKVALLAYVNDESEIVIVSVRVKHEPSTEPGNPGHWIVQEVARFGARGPHPPLHPTDPDCTPHGSSFSLSWGPWLSKAGGKTCMISYITKGYVGFRQITLELPVKPLQTPNVRVAATDASGVCLYLGPDAFVVWEDMIWDTGNSKVCRGIIATPSKAQAFQLPFDAVSGLGEHSTYECNSTFPSEEDSTQGQNPITGLIIHPPSPAHMTPTPLYTLARLSATHENDGWHQTNLPLTTDLGEENTTAIPRWATEIRQSIEHELPRLLAYQQDVFGENKIFGEDDDDEDGGDDEEEYEESEMGDYYEEDDKVNFLGVRGLDTADQVHVNRYRIWAMAVSPGGGTGAVFVTQHGTIRPDRDGYGGLRCRLLFGKFPTAVRHDDDGAGAGAGSGTYVKKLSTEAKMWEWIYGDGPPVPGISAPTADQDDGRTSLRDRFGNISQNQLCSFCGQPFRLEGNSARCEHGHSFDRCATTGVPILSPGISNACGVCGSKCLKQGEIIKLAPELESLIKDEMSTELCGGCGGKLLN
ncbi:transcription factor IIIC subunit delta N-term-domain-containing protein [Xylariomycetidae sp. FL0641]|nr:transcription factor IIIC subunit delta N-term-domain-containing protein [Xylariomycetidae sp. FL0641]